MPRLRVEGLDSLRTEALREALRGREAGIAIQAVLPHQDADIVVRVDPSLESYDTQWDWGVTRRVADTTTGLLVSAECRMHPRAGALAYAHEILVHARGYLHCPGPPGAPTGTLVHLHSPGWDFRGVS